MNDSIRFSLLERDERKIIRRWPPYRHPFEALDYALRDGGWLDHYGNVPGSIVLGAHRGGELVGFSILVPSTAISFEFYIAVRGDKVNCGFGKQLCIETLKTGFSKRHIEKIFLRVRKNHDVGIKLYTAIGFAMCGEVSELTNGIMTDFYVMDITRERFIRLYRRSS